MAPRVLVLGTAQDGGIPHAGCGCATCRAAHAEPARRRRVASIAVVGETERVLLVDATPDLARQLANLAARIGRARPDLDGLVLTHAHVGHYLGLAFLGREAMNVEGLPLYVTPSMADFLRANRPWAWLVERGQVEPEVVEPGDAFTFDGVHVETFLSPHRAEDTDTIGVEVRGPRRRLAYVPDADRFPPGLVDRIREADVALVDGTFYDASEIPGRDLAEIPHPFVADSAALLADPRGEVYFTHLNHTNRLLDPDRAGRPALPDGFGILAEDAAFDL